MGFHDDEAMMWVDGDLCLAGQASIPALDHAITVGDGIFEALKIIHGEIFALDRHLRRMERSAKGAGVPYPGHDAIAAAARAVVQANRTLLTGTHDVLRLTLTAGRGHIGSNRIPGVRPTLIAAVTHQTPRGLAGSAITTDWIRNERGALSGLKTTSYMENAMAADLASAAGVDEVMFANTVGHLCEGFRSNVFLVLDGQLVTPPLSDGPLAGITRQLVLEWVEVEERSVPFAALTQASEIFITSTVSDVMAITALDGHPIADGQIGPFTAAAQAAFAAGQALGLNP
ncbi:MAG: aminotransferase class IV [Propionibacteriaceae bacterium]|jgi:branched-chain amino acid aminotransferase|nr:aminotransferase class IV [Propionibacteriaceae bacterium]